MNTESLSMLIQDQILSIDDPNTEELLREAFYSLTIPGKDREVRMCASYDNGKVYVRFDLFNERKNLFKTVRVPLNKVPMLKEELKRQDWLNRLLADVRSRETKEFEDRMALLAKELDL